MKRVFIFVVFITIVLLNVYVVCADETSIILKGDADRNGIVNSDDALLVLEILAHVKEMDSTFSIRHSDLTGDYELSADDALNILKVTAKIMEQETIEDSLGIYDSIEYKDGYPVGYGINSEGNVMIPRVSYLLWSSNYYGDPSVYKYESNAAFWKLSWLIEDNLGTDNMELVYSLYVNVPFLPVSLSDTPRFFTSINVPPLGRKAYLMYFDGVPHIHFVYSDKSKESELSGTYKYTGKIPYELSEEYLNNTYLKWRKEQYETMNKSEKNELRFNLRISDKGVSIRDAVDSANTARLVIKLKLDPLRAIVDIKTKENLKGTYRFDVQDDDIYIIDLRYDGYNIGTDFDVAYSFKVFDESFIGPEVVEVKAYDLDGLEVPVFYTIIHPND